jgi:hypothetical protein
VTSNAQTLMMNPATEIRFASEGAAERLLPVSLALIALVTGALVVIDAPSPLRSIVALVFLGIVPGLSIVNLFGLGDFTQKLVMSIGLSLALDTIVAGLAVYAGLWSPTGILGVLIGITVVGAGLQLKFLAETGTSAAPGLLWDGPADEQGETPWTGPVAIATYTNVDFVNSAPEAARNVPSVRMTRAVVLVGYIGFICGLIMIIAMKINRGFKA